MERRYQHIVILTGAGISAESGIKTFRAHDGLWEEHRIEDVATPEGYARDPQLVQRFYDPSEGWLLMDGVDLRLADPAEVRARIAIVPQEAVVFMGTARSNILYGRPDASEAEVWAAAEAANAATFLRALPGGLDTELGEGGSQLSGGQRQR